MANILPWTQVTQREDYQALSIDEQEEVREAYWQTISASIPDDDLADARQVFDDETRIKSAGASEWGKAWDVGVERTKQMAGAGLEMLGKSLEDAARKRFTPEAAAFKEEYESKRTPSFLGALSPSYRPMPVDPEEIKVDEFGKELKEKAQQHLANMPKAPGFVQSGDWWENLKDPETFNAQMAWMLGSNVQPTIAIGAASLLSGMAAGPVGAGAAGSMGAYLLESGSSYDELLKMGVPEEDARGTASIVGAVNAGLEMVPLGRVAAKTPILRKLIGAEVQKELVKKPVLRRAAVELLKQGSFEGATEAIQEVVQNAGKKVYNENQDLLEGTGESAFVGGIMGGLFGAGAAVMPQPTADPKPITDPQAVAAQSQAKAEAQQAGLSPEQIGQAEAAAARQRSEQEKGIPLPGSVEDRSATLKQEATAQVSALQDELGRETIDEIEARITPRIASQEDLDRIEIPADQQVIPYTQEGEVLPEAPVLPTAEMLPAPEETPKQPGLPGREKREAIEKDERELLPSSAKGQLLSDLERTRDTKTQARQEDRLIEKAIPTGVTEKVAPQKPEVEAAAERLPGAVQPDVIEETGLQDDRKTEVVAADRKTETEPEEVTKLKTEKLSYEDWSKRYQDTLKQSLKYTPNQAGSQIYSEKLADLVDAYPNHEKRFDQEQEQQATVKGIPTGVTAKAQRADELGGIGAKVFVKGRKAKFIIDEVLPGSGQVYLKYAGKRLKEPRNIDDLVPVDPVKKPAQPARKPVGELTNSEINKRLKSLDKRSSALTDKLIAAGRGNEKISETIAKSDPLSRNFAEIIEQQRELRNEAETRYGPGFPGTLPKGGARIKPQPELPIAEQQQQIEGTGIAPTIPKPETAIAAEPAPEGKTVPAREQRSLKLITMPAEQVEIEETGEIVEIRETAETATKRIDTKLSRLYALRDCLRQ